MWWLWAWWLEVMTVEHWGCGTCGAAVSSGRLHCPVCGYFRVAGVGDCWRCASCLLYNTPDAEVCDFCGTAHWSALDVPAWPINRAEWEVLRKKQRKFFLGGYILDRIGDSSPGGWRPWLRAYLLTCYHNWFGEQEVG